MRLQEEQASEEWFAERSQVVYSDTFGIILTQNERRLQRVAALEGHEEFQRLLALGESPRSTTPTDNYALVASLLSGKVKQQLP